MSKLESSIAGEIWVMLLNVLVDDYGKDNGPESGLTYHDALRS